MTSKKSPPKKSPHPKGASRSARPSKERYFKHPVFLKKWHDALMESRWLRGGFLALILVALAAGLVFLALRLWEPPPLSKFLPDTTWRYTEGVLNPDERPWVNGLGPKVGEAFFTDGKDDRDGSFPQVQFYAFTDKKNVENELVAGQALKHAKIIGRYLVIADSDASLAVVEGVRSGDLPSLHQEPRFLRLRPHLPYRPERFDYRASALRVTPTHYEWLNTEVAARRAWLDKPITRLFTGVFSSTGVATKADGVHQAYTVGDKAFTEGAPLFHFTEKYQGNLLEFLPDRLKTLTAGRDLTALVEQFTALLDRADGVSGQVLRGVLVERFREVWPAAVSNSALPAPPVPEALKASLEAPVLPAPEAVLAALFAQEYAYATTEDGARILLLELSDESMPLVEQWTQTLLTEGLNDIDKATGRLRNIPLRVDQAESHGRTYDQIKKAGGELWLAKALEGRTLILATSKTAMESVFAAMDQGPSYTNDGVYDTIKTLLSVTDHLRVTLGHLLTLSAFDDGLLTHQFLFGP